MFIFLGVEIVLYLSRKRKIAILVILDSILVGISAVGSLLFLQPFSAFFEKEYIMLMITSIMLYIMFGSIFKVFTRINRYTNLREINAITAATLCTTIVEYIFSLFAPLFEHRRLLFLQFILMTFLIVATRLVWRLIVELRQRNKAKYTHNILIMGAGEGGRVLINSLLSTKNTEKVKISGIIDDDVNKVGTYLNGIKVLGTTSDLNKLIKENEVDMLTVAIPSISKHRLNELFDLSQSLGVKLNIMPSMEEIAEGKVSFSKLKDIDVVDLLGREEVKLDIEQIKEKITNKVILVTGAGGSIGSEICRQVMRFNPRKLLLLGHGENSIYLINRELQNKYRNRETEIIPIIADVQDRPRIDMIMEMYHPDIVYHAAAHKHVPLMEYNPVEAVKNNVIGTRNVAESAKLHEVGSFVMVSTDKANNPPNVMGSTKRIAEMIVTGLNEEGHTKFSAVRFGNVLGSRGSVIPVFKEQIAKGGPITVTDFRMTRYFMTIPEASRLVIQSGALAKGGEIFILDMGEPVKILDLAKQMIKMSGSSEDEIKIIESGIRPGEKLYEELLLDKERNDQQVFDKIFVGNINGFSLEQVDEFVKTLDFSQPNVVGKKVVEFANASNK
ncbi:short-chain dehydrogenase [Enterococcus cecorum]|nr:nucleoside-diphosphate sugar epimerase/dehydratase [Enterococcus cecorum]KLO64423.1 short-chain dehydrogenase [Enterococcus cecorum]KLO68182.1 short-chain dehydrogenase [Enterococcus cecorum]KLO68646.1 short-chain dehydrogenase [Enterococcus cecorum]KLO73680.1 short-chain dehydrogenase [Enterococcus cecorum]